MKYIYINMQIFVHTKQSCFSYMFLPICNPDSFPTHGVSRVTEGTAAFAKRLEDRALPVFGSTRAAEAPFSKAIWRKSREKIHPG